MSPTPYYEDDSCVIYHGDCREVLPSIEADVLFTSPPYAQQRDYGGALSDEPWDQIVPPALASTSAGQVLVNLGLVHRDGAVDEYWMPLLDAMRAEGHRLFGWYVWDQGWGLPGEWSGRFAPSHEFIFHFNRKATALYKTERSRSFGQRISGTGLRGKSTTKGAFTGQGNLVGEWKVPDSVVRVTREMRRDIEHPARFPLALPMKVLSAFTGDTILDPFMGSGTTLRAAKDLGRKAIGIEIEERYCEIAAKRLAQEVLDLGSAA